MKLPSWDYYEPQYLHNSSFSLSAHSVLASDIGDPELGGKLRISPNLPKTWEKLSCTLLRKGQHLTVAVTPEQMEIVSQADSAPAVLDVMGKEYTPSKELTAANKMM